MRVLITGVAGHIGSKLAALALEHGADVVGVDDLSCGYVENVPAGIDFIHADAGELDDVGCREPIFAKRFDVVYHLAAYAAECYSPFVRKFNYTNNLVSTVGLLNQVLAEPGLCGRFVFASSAAVYGKGFCPLDELSDCKPHDPYGVAKLACEQDIKIAGEQHGLDWCIVRPHNVYGPGQSIWQRYRNVFGLWMRAILEDKPLTVFGDGTQRRAFSYIYDVLPALWAAGTTRQAKYQTINIGGAKPITINEAVSALREATGMKSLDVDYAAPRHEVKDVWCTTQLSEQILGYEDFTTLETGLREMWTWVQEAWPRYVDRRRLHGIPPIEVERGLPDGWKG